jgi:hypothetical protein
VADQIQPNLRHGNWQTTWPEEEGDWLWIRQWGCGCCLIDAGVAWVYPFVGTEQEWATLREKYPRSHPYTPNGRRMVAAWWGNAHRPPPFVDEEPDVTWWQRVDLPPHPDDIEAADPAGAA